MRRKRRALDFAAGCVDHLAGQQRGYQRGWTATPRDKKRSPAEANLLGIPELLEDDLIERVECPLGIGSARIGAVRDRGDHLRRSSRGPDRRSTRKRNRGKAQAGAGAVGSAGWSPHE